MSDKNNIYFNAQSNNAFLVMIGAFIRHHRLNQDKSQSQLATESGINRSTLIELEKGKRANMLTLIQILRALHLLSILEVFRVEQHISPLQLAEMEMAKRKRASKIKPGSARVQKNKSDW